MKIIWYNEHLLNSLVRGATLKTTISMCIFIFKYIYFYLYFSAFISTNLIHMNVHISQNIESFCYEHFTGAKHIFLFLTLTNPCQLKDEKGYAPFLRKIIFFNKFIPFLLNRQISFSVSKYTFGSYTEHFFPVDFIINIYGFTKNKAFFFTISSLLSAFLKTPLKTGY